MCSSSLGLPWTTDPLRSPACVLGILDVGYLRVGMSWNNPTSCLWEDVETPVASLMIPQCHPSAVKQRRMPSHQSISSSDTFRPSSSRCQRLPSCPSILVLLFPLWFCVRYIFYERHECLLDTCINRGHLAFARHCRPGFWDVGTNKTLIDSALVAVPDLWRDREENRYFKFGW